MPGLTRTSGAMAAPTQAIAPDGHAAAAHVGWAGPAEVWTAWTWAPFVITAMVLLMGLYLMGVRRLWRHAGRGRGIAGRRVAAYLSGIAALAIALLSPVAAVGEALFSVHMFQHVLLMVAAPPLIVLGRPGLAAAWALPENGRRAVRRHWPRAPWFRAAWRGLTHPVTVFALHVGALWAWHIPALYEAALENRTWHHVEHASFFFTALLFWWALARIWGVEHRTGRGRGRWPGYGAGALYVFATALQSGALGALLVFSPRVLYPAHAEGTAAWGADLLVDQQLAGAIMWIPPGIVYATAILLLFLAWLREAEG